MLKHIVAFTFAAALSQAAIAADQQSISVYNWNDYIDPAVIEDFTKETGIKVNYGTYETAEDLEKIAASDSADVVSPGLDLVARFIKSDLIQPYNARTIGGYDDIQSIIRARMFSQDPTGQYIMPYMWGRVGILIDRKAAEAALGEPITATWDTLFNLEKVQKLSQCGVSFLDARDYVYSLGLNYSGEPLDFPTNRAIQRYTDLLMAIRPHLKVVDSADHLDLAPKGELCVTMVWEGDAVAIQADRPDLEFVLPEEGSVMFIDTMAISKKAKNPEGARKWIEFMSRKDIALRNARYTSYNSPNMFVLDEMAIEHEAQTKEASVSIDGVPVFMSVAAKGKQAQMFADAWHRFVRGDDKIAATPAAAPVSYQ